MTTPERYRRIVELYHAALALAPGERARFLESACGGDEPLRAEVASLLAAAVDAGDFIETPALVATAASVAASAPALAPGVRIGPYQVQAPIGRGGMGEVYRAHDARLGRDVALKVLPDRFGGDAQRLTRFEREARLLASFAHPNIAALYGIEESEGRPVLVMELVDGATLENRLAAGRIALADALHIAVQIVDALDAAHERDIVHRDLKPANIIVRHDGAVKVLDFGLAKVLAATSADEDSSLTDDHMVIGTTPYMSPEQARGGAVDHRADIWAFGCVLYEMIAGRRAFDGDTRSDVIAAVLGRGPDWSALPEDTPPLIRRLLRRCLEKHPRDRLRHIGDARLDLVDAVSPTSSVAAGIAPSTRSRLTMRLASVVAGVAVIAGAAGWTLSMHWRSAAVPVTRLSMSSMGPPSVATFGKQHVAISRDGFRVAYAAADRLLIRRMDQQESLAVNVEGFDPFFSPDGEWVAFFLDTGKLQKVPVHGGAPTTITDTVGRPSGGSWRTDGTIVFGTSQGLYLVPDRGGRAEPLARPDASRNELAYASPHLLPDGQSLLFTIVPEGLIDGAKIALLDLKTRNRTIVVPSGKAARYVSTGHLVYTSGSTLTAVAFDPDARRVRGEPVPFPDIQVFTASDIGAADFDVSETGTLVFMPPVASPPPVQNLVWVNRRGAEEAVPIAPGRYRYPRVSPDGQRIAIDVLGANRDVWMFDVKRQTTVRLTHGPSEDQLPLWSRSGRIFFSSLQNGNFDVYSQAPDGATAARVEFEAPGDQMPLGFTPDGTQLIVNENYRDVSVLTLTPPHRLEPLLHSSAGEWCADVSPDGKWVAYESDESGDQVEIFVRPFPAVDAGRQKVSLDGGRYPLWSPDGKELYYVTASGAMMAVSVRLSPTLALGGVTKLFDTRPPTHGISSRPYDVSPVDGRFLVTKPVVSGAAPGGEVTVVLNWLEDLKRRVPTR